MLISPLSQFLNLFRILSVSHVIIFRSLLCKFVWREHYDLSVYLCGMSGLGERTSLQKWQDFEPDTSLPVLSFFGSRLGSISRHKVLNIHCHCISLDHMMELVDLMEHHGSRRITTPTPVDIRLSRDREIIQRIG
jgi:hypothetical protein